MAHSHIDKMTNISVIFAVLCKVCGSHDGLGELQDPAGVREQPNHPEIRVRGVQLLQQPRLHRLLQGKVSSLQQNIVSDLMYSGPRLPSSANIYEQHLELQLDKSSLHPRFNGYPGHHPLVFGVKMEDCPPGGCISGY